jgi:hypothetical protein
MIRSNWLSDKHEYELEVSLYSKGQSYLDLSIIAGLAFSESIELNKKQVSELIVALVEMHKEMS